MKTEELLDKIIREGKLKDNTILTLTEWIIENQGKETVSVYLSAINEDKILTLTPKGKAQGKIVFKRLSHSPFFNGLAVKYFEKGWFNEAEQIFKAILSRTPNDMDSELNYGACLINQLIKAHDEGRGIDREQLEKARNLIFNAYNYDKKAHEDWRLKPAYKNLCYVRAIEAVDYYYKKEVFTAFVLGWVSIEMSLYRIWFKLITGKTAHGITTF